MSKSKNKRYQYQFKIDSVIYHADKDERLSFEEERYAIEEIMKKKHRDPLFFPSFGLDAEILIFDGENIIEHKRFFNDHRMFLKDKRIQI